MSSDLLAKWLACYDPVHRGWTPAGIANGLCATNGFFFPRIRGGYNLRRSSGRVPTASDPIVGAAGADAASVHTFPWVSHEAGGEYVYRLTAVGGGGVENFADDVTAAVAFDDLGHWVGRLPNAPADLRVLPTVGGRFIVRWTYTGQCEQVEPAAFRLYHDQATGTVDFSSPAATVPYRRGRFHYEHVSEEFEHDTGIQWVVRAVSEDGAEEDNDRFAFARASSAPPPINPAVHIRVV